jgi:hypothetical protein
VDETIACAGDASGLDYGEALTTAEVVAGFDDISAAGNRVQLQAFAWIKRCQLRRVWIDDDCRDIYHWIALRMGITTYKARRWVACAWALERYPLFTEAFEQGLLSTDKLVELTRLADAVDEPERKLLRWAKKVAIATIRERALRVDDDDMQDAVQQRALRWWWDAERTRVNLSGSLPADMGVRVTSALDRAARRLPVCPEDDGDPESSLEARRADALDLLAARMLAQDADVDRATVVVHAPLSALVAGDCNGAGGTGEVLAPAVVDRLACDCRLQGVLHGDDGAIVGIGTTSRMIPRWLRRQIEHRDGFRCVFPNCGSKLGLDCHHVVPWSRGGPTEPDNLVMLCRTHHRLVHEYGWHLMLGADQTTTWFRPDWTPYEPRPPSKRPQRSAQREPGPERPGAEENVAAATEPPEDEPDRAESPERKGWVVETANGPFKLTPWWERLGGAF